MTSTLIPRAVAAAFAFAVVAAAQQLPFQLSVTIGSSVITTQNGSTLVLSSIVGQPQVARVKALYSGNGQVTIAQQPIVIGSTDFTAQLTAAPSLTLNRGDSVSFDIRFVPTTTSQNDAKLILSFDENPPTANAAKTIELSLQGTVSSIVASYILPADGNTVPLESGGVIVFPATPVKTTSQAAFNLTNRGSAVGKVTGVSVTGPAFRLSGLPLFPFTLTPGQNLQVQVVYQPSIAGSDAGQITASFDAASPITINLQGSGSSASFIYQVLQANPLVVPAGGTVSLPDTNVGETSNVSIRILNAGNGEGAIHTITSAGQGFELSNLPALPQTLAPNASLTFTITFSPTRSGTLNGSLIINSDTLNLRGVALGAQLNFFYVSGGTSITISAGAPSVVFSPVMISRSAQIDFHVRNAGTLSAVVANIGVTQVNAPFSVSGLPTLPLTLAPNTELQFTINFAPTVLGFSNGTLQIDRTTVPLVGSGTEPPPLPSYTIVGPSGNSAPGSQTSVGLTLASPYPVAVAGTLALSVSGDLPADPAVQFASGGRTVPFVIPANSTTAVFGSQQATRIGLQTGTVASTMTLTPSFATQAGAVDLNPATPTRLQFAVAPAAPTLTGIQISNPSANSLVIKVTGFVTGRSLTSWNVQFTTVPGVSMPTSQFNIDIQQIAATWFQSSASQAFGGQFTMAIQFNFQGSASAVQSPLASIASVNVGVSSQLGASNSLQAKIQ